MEWDHQRNVLKVQGPGFIECVFAVPRPKFDMGGDLFNRLRKLGTRFMDGIWLRITAMKEGIQQQLIRHQGTRHKMNQRVH